jgi:hypothetical protein
MKAGFLNRPKNSKKETNAMNTKLITQTKNDKF